MSKRKKSRNRRKRASAITLACIYTSLNMSMIAGAEVSFPQPDNLDAGVTTELAKTVNINDTYRIKHNGVSGQVFNNSWKSFDVPANKYADFNFSNSNQISVNRITGANASRIYGQITQSGAGGTVYLINPSGVLFGPDSRVNLNSFAVSTYDLTDINGKNFNFDAISGSGKIINEGIINIENEGFAAFLSPVIENKGEVLADGGVIAFLSGNEISFETNTGETISINVDKEQLESLQLESNEFHINNTGLIQANGGKIVITADTANELFNSTVNTTGIVKADTIREVNGELVFGNIEIDTQFAGLGGTITASGEAGGNITINADNLSLADNIKATGTTSAGGNVDINVEGKTWETSTSKIDVSGAEGGTISHIAGKQITTSGNYKATGTAGKGGNVDITANALKFLSTKIDASGTTGGGKVQLGGEYQGGKHLAEDEIPNAKTLAMTSGTEVRADGGGGEIISWADEDAVVLGDFSAKDGGFIEVSAGNNISFKGYADAGIGGNFELDPKTIVIDDVNYSEYPIMIGYNYEDDDADNLNTNSYASSQDYFGTSVSIDGNRLAVGSGNNDGFNNDQMDSGAVYLYTFTDADFSGGTLAAMVGDGYIGGNNVDQTLGKGDRFGRSVSLNGNRLAVGSHLNDGSGITNRTSKGAVYLYTFTDAVFSGGNLEATIGDGYAGVKDIDLTLKNNDFFGTSVSLDGTRLAVGAVGDDGFGDIEGASGAVYLFTFTDAAFSGGSHVGTIGDSYAGAKDIDQDLDNDSFGNSVSLNGNRLAVGSPSDDGFGGGQTNCGAVYLYSFTDAAFSGGNLEAIIGDGYAGVKDVDPGLDVGDALGWSVSLDNNALAIGAYYDDGFGGAQSQSGAVYLYSFTDAAFSGGNLEAMIGDSYAGVKDINQDLDDDQFGYSVSLNTNRLAVGAWFDQGADDLDERLGAVYLYTFTDAVFSGGNLEATIGKGYTGGKNIDQDLDGLSYFAHSVSLDDTRLAVGDYYDNGSADNLGQSGAVYLYSFTDQLFSGATLEGIVGDGYVGGKNIDQTLEAGDQFGYSVSVDENRLAVGAIGDDGFGNAQTDSGAVYLYSFTDLTFSGGNLESTIGDSYAGAKDINLDLDDDDNFGSGVSIDGNRLAAGAVSDDGFDNDKAYPGAVYLYTFTDSAFSGGNLEATIGEDYVGAKDIDLSLVLNNSRLGQSVSLDGNRLAVGVTYDKGFNDDKSASGAVYLFTFTDSAFSGGSHVGTVGDSYAGAKDIDLTLDAWDRFGYGVSLDDNILAVAAPYANGFNNIYGDVGEAYVFSFTDNAFSGGTLERTIGNGYVGANDINVGLGNPTSISVDGNRLAIGSISDDGYASGGSLVYDHWGSEYGAVFLYFLDNSTVIDSNLFSSRYNRGVTIATATIESLLSSAQDVTLSASNDIFLNNDITANNGGGDGGNFTLQAGRSVSLDGSITTDNGDLTVIANDTAASGVVDSERDAGNAGITLTAGKTIDAGTGDVLFELRDGAGNTNTASGDIDISGDITANTVTMLNTGTTAGSDIIMNVGSSITGTAANSAIVLSTVNGNFTNNVGDAVFSTPAGRWLVYSSHPDNTLENIAAYNKIYNRTYAANAPGTIPAGNHFLYSVAPSLTITAEDKTKTYGDANAALTYTVSAGLIDGDVVGDALSGAASITTTAVQASNVGTYVIDAAAGTLTSPYGYTLSYVDGTYTVDKAPLTVTVDDQAKTFGAANPALTASYAGFVLGEDESILGGSITTNAVQSSPAGVYDITGSTLTSDNYDITSIDGELTVTSAVTDTETTEIIKIVKDNDPGLIINNTNTEFNNNMNFTPSPQYAKNDNFDGIEKALISINLDHYNEAKKIIPVARKMKKNSNSKDLEFIIEGVDLDHLLEEEEKD